MSELKACPFCGQELTYFGKDRWYGEISDCYKHPQSETIKCPISSLIFPKDLWNTRPLESVLQSALTTAQEENKLMRETIVQQERIIDRLKRNGLRLATNYKFFEKGGRTTYCRYCGFTMLSGGYEKHQDDCPITLHNQLMNSLEGK